MRNIAIKCLGKLLRVLIEQEDRPIIVDRFGRAWRI